MPADIISFLASLGLSEKETELYLSALKTGPQTASVLAKRTGIPRSTVNFLFGQLIQKGFAHRENRENTTYFSVIDPESIEYILLKKTAEVKKQASDFTDLLPQLIGVKNSNTLLPKVSYYEGLEALCRTIDDCCSKDEAVYFISSHGNMHPKIREYIERVYLPKSKKKKNKNKMIISDSEASRAYAKKAEGVYEEVVFMDPAKHLFKVTMAIHGNKVDFISYDPSDLSGIVIENPLIAEHMRAIFDALKLA